MCCTYFLKNTRLAFSYRIIFEYCPLLEACSGEQFISSAATNIINPIRGDHYFNLHTWAWYEKSGLFTLINCVLPPGCE